LWKARLCHCIMVFANNCHKGAKFRVMDTTEIQQESWEVNTSDSWSQLSCILLPTEQTSISTLSAPPTQIVIPRSARSVNEEDKSDIPDTTSNPDNNTDAVNDDGKDVVLEDASSLEESSSSEEGDSSSSSASSSSEPEQDIQNEVVASNDSFAAGVQSRNGFDFDFRRRSTTFLRYSPRMLMRSAARFAPFSSEASTSTFQTDQAVRTKRQRRRASIIEVPKRYFRYALALWVLELVLVVTLKRVGVIEPEFRFDEAVAQQMMKNFGNESSQLVALVQKGMQLWGNETERVMQSIAYLAKETQRPGYQLAQQGAQAKYPLVIVPGFVTSGLEVWGGKECARRQFRQRMWTAMVGARSFLTDRDCWQQHMMLDPKTGGDPDEGNIRLRAASGFEAIDYFMANYWVFGKIIENLADVGYTPSEMTVMPYDWRLATPMLEKRDGYFTKLKAQIEAMYEASGGTKVVLTSHSMGALVVHYFFAWATSAQGGGGGRNWVDRHIHAYINIAGTHLGVPKAVTALLSGEMSDTVLMNPLATAVEQFFGRQARRELWNSWGSIWSMMPKGGDSLWGAGVDMCNATISGATEADAQNKNVHGKEERADSKTSEIQQDLHCLSKKSLPLLAITDSKETLDEIVGPIHSTLMTRRRAALHHHDVSHHHHENASSVLIDGTNQTAMSPKLKHFLAHQDFSVKAVIDLVKDLSHNLFEGVEELANKDMYEFYSESEKRPTANRHSEKAWHDPTQTPLPHAPNMKVYCLYGVGKPTERAYYYKLNRAEVKPSDASAPNQSTRNETKPTYLLNNPPFVLDSDVTPTDPNQQIEHGIKYSDGDGSVPLLSLGYICADAWTRKSSGLNPSKASVYTREYQHTPEFTVDDPMRSGPKSGDHVDILGNNDMNQDLLRILTDFELEEVNKNQISSDILQIAKTINAEKGRGIFS